MINIILECNDFLKDCDFTYAFCGGYALDLYLNKKVRIHSDIDISVFDIDRKKVVEFFINQSWNIYGRAERKLFLLTDSEDKRLSDCSTLWGIKPDFESTVPFLPDENRNWLINAIETAYPNGHKRLDELKKGSFSSENIK